MIGDTKGALDDGGDPRASPEGTAEAKGLGTLIEQGGQLCALLGAQTRERAFGFLAPQGIETLRLGTREPFADRALPHAQRIGDLLLTPALLMEFPSTQAPAFAPIARLGRQVGIHTPES